PRGGAAALAIRARRGASLRAALSPHLAAEEAARGVASVRILLTNDDGIYAPGLRALRKELQKLGEVVVVAPAAEQSAVGHSITLLTPLLIQEVVDDGDRIGWAVE